MKIKILNKEGKKVREAETKLFEEPVREDLIRKVVESERIWHPYSNKFRAGMNRSASGNVSHRRHDWKSDRGKGMSRIPKKTMWRRGTQFSWEGAIVPNVKGGRRAHPPKGSVNLKKINKKELKKALLSALNYITLKDEIRKKYSRLSDKQIKTELPIVLEDSIINLKPKEFYDSIKNVLGDLSEVGLQKKTIRAGRGKSRGRKYKKSAGMLIIIGENDDFNINKADVVSARELIVSDLASNGARLVLFTEKSLKELEKLLFGKRDKKIKDKKMDRKDIRKIKKQKRKKIGKKFERGADK